MKVLIPKEFVPITSDPVEITPTTLQHGYSMYRGGRWSARFMLGYGFPRADAVDQNLSWYSETTDWFSVKEFVPPVEGWYECRIVYRSGIVEGEEHPTPYLFYWEDGKWSSGGWRVTDRNPFQNLGSRYFSDYVIYFRGIKHQWKEKN